MARQQHPAGLRLLLFDPPQQLYAVHFRHQVIRKHHIHRIALRITRRLLRVRKAVDRVIRLQLQKGLDARNNHLLVVDNHDRWHASVGAHRALLLFCCTGIRMWNVVPSPGRLSKFMVPPCLSSMISREMERPRPVPSPTGLVVKPASKACAWVSEDIPRPVSEIETWTISPSIRVRTVIRPSPSIACPALTSRFKKTWLSICG